MGNKKSSKLANMLRDRMDMEGLSVRDAGKLIGVSHSTVARAVNGEVVEIETLKKFCSFLGVPVESMLDLKDDNDELLNQILRVISIEPELAEVFIEIGQALGDNKLDKIILNEIAAFSHCRLDYLKKNDK